MSQTVTSHVWHRGQRVILSYASSYSFWPLLEKDDCCCRCW